MKVSKVLETPEGNVTFEGEIKGAELEFMVGFFLNQMLIRGTLPFMNRDPATVDVSAVGDHQ